MRSLEEGYWCILEKVEADESAMGGVVQLRLKRERERSILPLALITIHYNKREKEPWQCTDCVFCERAFKTTSVRASNRARGRRM